MNAALSLLFGTAICSALLCLAWIAWQQKQELDALRIEQRTQEVESGNKIALLEQLTCYDALTGLRNQRMFEDELATMLRNRTPLALIYIDLDGLKQINTERGHQVADQVIRSAAKAIRASLQRRTDRKHVYRRGTAADEFLVMLERADLTTGILLAEQILMALRMLPTPTTASIGVTAWDGHSYMTTDDLERAAELEMERAEANGRNRVHAPTPPQSPNREHAKADQESASHCRALPRYRGCLTMAIKENPKRCLRCNSVSVCPRKGVGRTRHYRVLAQLPIPDDFEIPTCGRCGSEYSEESIDRKLDQVLAAVYLDSLQALAKATIGKLTERDPATKRRHISQRQMELMLGLSQGYLSRLLSGHGKPSAPLVLLLGLLSLSPEQTLGEVQRFWRLASLPLSTENPTQKESL